jgi:hypothetical protein
MENLKIAKAVTTAAGLDHLTLEGVWLTLHGVTELEENEPCQMAILVVLFHLVFYHVELYQELMTFVQLGPVLPEPDAVLAKDLLRLGLMLRGNAREFKAESLKKEEDLSKLKSIAAAQQAAYAAALEEVFKHKRTKCSWETE